MRRRLRPLSTNPCIRFGHTIPVANHVDVVITQDAPGPNITHSESHVSPLCRAALRRCAACPLRRTSGWGLTRRNLRGRAAWTDFKFGDFSDVIFHSLFPLA
eukprot:COSAG01_NODE_10691_length_2104_cov_2.161596_3_plen_101_part_01